MYFPFLNCRNGTKDPLRSADAIVRCCLKISTPSVGADAHIGPCICYEIAENNR